MAAYDQVVIDCAPGLSQLVWGALRIADLVLIPYIPDRTAEDNVGWLAHRLKEIGGTMSSPLPIAYRARTAGRKASSPP